MLLTSAQLAIGQLLSKPFRKIFWRSIFYTILLLIGAGFLLESAITTFLVPAIGDLPMGGWLATAAVWLTGFGMIAGAGFLIAPVSALFAGIFLDEIAAEVEAHHYPGDAPGTPLPTAIAFWLTVKFTTLVVIANIISLMLVLLPGINFLIFFFLNGYLLGREYFQFAAMRFLSQEDAKILRQENEGSVFFGGMIIAGFMSIPLLNLATPIFAAAMMVHIFKASMGRSFNHPVAQ